MNTVLTLHDPQDGGAPITPRACGARTRLYSLLRAARRRAPAGATRCAMRACASPGASCSPGSTRVARATCTGPACAAASASRCGCRSAPRAWSRCSPARATATSATPRCTRTTPSAEIVQLLERTRAAALVVQAGYGADAHGATSSRGARAAEREGACTRCRRAGHRACLAPSRAAGRGVRQCRRSPTPTRSSTSPSPRAPPACPRA